MARLTLVDTTLRDGNQSLWGATALTTGMVLEAAPLIDRVGYAAIDFMTSTHMAIAVRFHRENPWERVRLMRAAMPATPLGFLTTGMRFISWERAHDELMRLSFRALTRCGIGRYWVMDPMNDMDAVCRCARMIHEEGGREIIAALVYTESPVHDDRYYAGCAAVLAQSPHVTRVYVKDPGGLLRPERARTLIAAVRAAVGSLPLELHSHCNLALAPFSYLEAAAQGVQTLHVAVAAGASGSAQPEARRTIANLRALGHEVDVDEAALAAYGNYVDALAAAEGLTPGVAQEYDAAALQHQVPGGMITTLMRQLREVGQSERLAEVLEEIARVRAELGFPIMVTPLSQVVGAQAVMNVVSGGERYRNVPDEVVRYVLGRFGSPPAPVDPNVLDRIESLPRARVLADEPPMPDIATLRRRIGHSVDDEELLLRATMPDAQVDAMLAAGPARRRYSPTAATVKHLIRELSARAPLAHVRIDKPGFALELRAAQRV